MSHMKKKNCIKIDLASIWCIDCTYYESKCTVRGGDDSKSEYRKAGALACMCGSVTVPEIQLNTLLSLIRYFIASPCMYF